MRQHFYGTTPTQNVVRVMKQTTMNGKYCIRSLHQIFYASWTTINVLGMVICLVWHVRTCSHNTYEYVYDNTYYARLCNFQTRRKNTGKICRNGNSVRLTFCKTGKYLFIDWYSYYGNELCFAFGFDFGYGMNALTPLLHHCVWQYVHFCIFFFLLKIEFFRWHSYLVDTWIIRCYAF